MSASVLYMSMSLDGFIAGPNERPDNGLGDGGHRLHEWALPGGGARREELSRATGVNGQVVDEFMATGAVVAGRGTFEPAGGWGGDHHDGVPMILVARGEPGIDTGQWPLVTYVDDVTTAMSEAKQAAGEKNVLVHGAGTAQRALAAGVLDELEIDLVPVLLGHGRRLFDNLSPEHIELERTRVLEGDGVTHLHTGPALSAPPDRWCNPSARGSSASWTGASTGRPSTTTGSSPTSGVVWGTSSTWRCSNGWSKAPAGRRSSRAAQPCGSSHAPGRDDPPRPRRGRHRGRTQRSRPRP